MAASLPTGRALFLSALALAGCSPLEPCTECPDVSGTYEARAAPIDPVSGAGGQGTGCAAVAFPGVQDLLEVNQDVKLPSRLSTRGWLELEGILYEDASFILGPADYLQTGAGTLRITLTGRFLPVQGGYRSSGQVRLELTGEPCDMRTPLELIQRPEGG